MSFHRFAWACYLAVLPVFASAQGAWRSETDQPLLETPSRKSVDGFGAAITLTANPDWEQKIRAKDGPHGLPVIEAALGTAIGGKLWLLTLYTNPLPDQSGNVRVSNHVVVSSPDGTTAIDQRNVVCFEGSISGSAQLVRLCSSRLQLGFDPGDPIGIWHISVTVRDETRNVEVPLETTFEVRAR